MFSGLSLTDEPTLVMCKDDKEKGLASGFPYCCVYWYIYNMPRLSFSQGVWWVPCPVHWLLNRFKLLWIIYYKCENCNWYQYNKSICNLCYRPMQPATIERVL